jgi:glycosyltransferase involved in cell wall biosynthesis
VSSHITVSIVIPIKGRPDFFELTAASLRNQTCQQWEAIVVDDHSSEEDFARISAIVSRDARMRLAGNPNRRRGAASCRNAGLAMSAGEYVIFLDSDDALSPVCLEKRLQIMRQHPALDFAAFPSWLFHEEPGDSRLLWNGFDDRNDMDRFLRQDAPWQTTGPIWRKASLTRAGLFWDERAKSWQDWEFHIRALVAGLSYVKIPEPDCFYRSSWKGGMTGSSFAPSKVFNRARLLARLAEYFRAHGAAASAYRGLLAAHVFRHAFCSGMRRHRAFVIWSMAYRAKLVSLLEFYAVLFSRMLVWLTARATRALERFLLPELSSIQTGTHLATTEPLLKKGNAKSLGHSLRA